MELIERGRGTENQFYLLGLNNLASVVAQQGRAVDAEPIFLKAIELTRKLKLADYPFVTKVEDNLARMYVGQGRYSEAEKIAREELAITLKAVGVNHADSIISLNTLALVWTGQERKAEVETLLKKILSATTAVYGANHYQVSHPTTELGLFLLGQNRPREAAPLLERSLQILEQTQPDGPEAIYNMQVLSWIYAMVDNRQAEASALAAKAAAKARKLNAGAVMAENTAETSLVMALAPFRNADLRHMSTEDLARLALSARLVDDNLANMRKVYGADDPRILTAIGTATGIHWMIKDDAKARQLVEDGFRIIAATPPGKVAPGDRMMLYQWRGKIEWRQGERPAAIEDMKQTTALADSIRAQAAGAVQDRAAYGTQYVDYYLQLAAWCAAEGDVAGAFEAAERGGSRVLQDQIELHGVDLLAGLPPDEASALNARKLQAHSRVGQLQLEIQRAAARTDLSPAERQQMIASKSAELDLTRGTYLEIYREICNASPGYRLTVSRDRRPATLSALSTWCARNATMVLDYVIGDTDSCAVAISPDGKASAHALSVTEADGKTLRIAPGNLTRESLSRALVTADRHGMRQLLEQKDASPERTAKLAALYRILVPTPAQAALAKDSCRGLVVLATDDLALLPFETLVVREGENPNYLLDSGPPISYASSGTVLLNLAERPDARNHRDDQPVLTIGNPNYSLPAGQPADALAEVARESRERSWAGMLTPLANTESECRWVADACKAHGLGVGQLMGADATERGVRYYISGRRIVHFACHGLVDQSHGNLFGALAITPGKNADRDPADDGFLYLAEIYELDLKGAELVILSACQTNYGPQQRGEGAWALSRGFLVAGSRRVLASNWLLDDEAAAQLIYFFSHYLFEGEKAGTADYARALRDAKLAIRQQEKWRSPYYWATMVLVGPR